MSDELEQLAIALIEACDAFRKKAAESNDTAAQLLCIEAIRLSNHVDEWVAVEQRNREINDA